MSPWIVTFGRERLLFCSGGGNNVDNASLTSLDQVGGMLGVFSMFPPSSEQKEGM